MLKATFFRRIAGEEITSTVGDQFHLIYEGWRVELRRTVGEDEAKDFETLVDYLTDISTYPDSTVLEKRYYQDSSMILSQDSYMNQMVR